MRLRSEWKHGALVVPAGTPIRQAYERDLTPHHRALWRHRCKQRQRVIEWREQADERGKPWPPQALRPQAWLWWVGGEPRFLEWHELEAETAADREWLARNAPTAEEQRHVAHEVSHAA